MGNFSWYHIKLQKEDLMDNTIMIDDMPHHLDMYYTDNFKNLFERLQEAVGLDPAATLRQGLIALAICKRCEEHGMTEVPIGLLLPYTKEDKTPSKPDIKLVYSKPSSVEPL
jgi:hypothetical protein